MKMKSSEVSECTCTKENAHRKPKKQKTQVWADYSLHHIFKIKFYTHFSNIYKSININSKIRSCLHPSHTFSKPT